MNEDELLRWVQQHTDPYLGIVTIDADVVVRLICRIKTLEELRSYDQKAVDACRRDHQQCTCGEAYGARPLGVLKCGYCAGGLNEKTSYTRNASSAVGGDAE